MAKAGVEYPAAFEGVRPGERRGVRALLANRGGVERQQRVERRRQVGEPIPFVGDAEGVGKRSGGGMRACGPGHRALRRAFGVAGEATADHLAVPGPVIVRIRRRVDRDDAAACADKASQRVAALAGEPFAGRIVAAGGGVEQYDRAIAAQRGRVVEDRRVFAGDGEQAVLLRDGADRGDRRFDRGVAVTGRVAEDQDRRRRDRGRRRRRRADQQPCPDAECQQPADHGLSPLWCSRVVDFDHAESSPSVIPAKAGIHKH